MSTFCFNTRMKTHAPLTDCRNTLIQFIPSCQDMQTQFVDILDLPFSDIACSIISCLVVAIFMPKNSIVTVLPFCARSPHRVVICCSLPSGVLAMISSCKSQVFWQYKPLFDYHAMYFWKFQRTLQWAKLLWIFQTSDGLASSVKVYQARLMSSSSARHHLKLQDHGHAATALCGVFV